MEKNYENFCKKLSEILKIFNNFETNLNKLWRNFFKIPYLFIL